MTTVGYRYECECGAVLADTSKHSDGTTRGMDGAGAFFVGRQLTPSEVPGCEVSTLGWAKHAGCGKDVTEVPVKVDTGRAFAESQERQEREAASVGDLLKGYGFAWWHTGGGCTAWGKSRGEPDTEDYVEILITDGNMSAPSNLSDPVCIAAFKGPDGAGGSDDLFIEEFKTVRAFLRALKAGKAKWTREVTK